MPAPAGWRFLLGNTLRLFVPWLVIAVGLTWAGWPGVMCITPLAWLLALPLGMRIESLSPSSEPGRRLRQAAVAGALLGLLQGLLFVVSVPALGPLRSREILPALGVALFLLLAGAIAAAGLAVLAAWLLRQRNLRAIR